MPVINKEAFLAWFQEIAKCREVVAVLTVVQLLLHGLESIGCLYVIGQQMSKLNPSPDQPPPSNAGELASLAIESFYNTAAATAAFILQIYVAYGALVTLWLRLAVYRPCVVEAAAVWLLWYATQIALLACTGLASAVVYCVLKNPLHLYLCVLGSLGTTILLLGWLIVFNMFVKIRQNILVDNQTNGQNSGRAN